MSVRQETGPPTAQDERPAVLRHELVDPFSDRRWPAFVDQAPGAGLFYHPAWLALLRNQYRYPISACCLVDEQGRIRAALPFARVESRLTGRRLVALPFSDFCAPAGEAAGELAPALDELRRELGLPFQVRWELEGTGHRGEGFFAVALRIDGDFERVESGFRREVRKATRQARREGVVGRVSTERSALDAFYDLHVHTRRRLGVPTQPRAFMRALGDLFDQGLGFTLLAEDGEGRPVGAMVLFAHRGVLTMKYSATDWSRRHLRPNNVLYADAIRWACEHGIHEIDMGRNGASQEGLRSFKASWGATETEIAYTHLADAAPQPGSERAERVLGAVLRRSPPIASRLAGQLLYRHAG